MFSKILFSFLTFLVFVILIVAYVLRVSVPVFFVLSPQYDNVSSFIVSTVRSCTVSLTTTNKVNNGKCRLLHYRIEQTAL